MRKILVLLTTLLFVSISFAQKSYTIKVTDAQTGKPIAHVSATNNTTKNGSISDENGSITISADNKQSVTLSCVGYGEVTIKLGTNTNV